MIDLSDYPVRKQTPAHRVTVCIPIPRKWWDDLPDDPGLADVPTELWATIREEVRRAMDSRDDFPVTTPEPVGVSVDRALTTSPGITPMMPLVYLVYYAVNPPGVGEHYRADGSREIVGG